MPSKSYFNVFLLLILPLSFYHLGSHCTSTAKFCVLLLQSLWSLLLLHGNGVLIFKCSYSDAVVTEHRLLQGLFGCICLYWVNVTISSECLFKCLLVFCSGYYRFLLLSSFGQFYFNALFVCSLPDLYWIFCLNFSSKWIPVVLLGEIQSGFPSLQTVLYLLNEVRVSVSGNVTSLI